MIDRALDAAEAKLMDSATTPEVAVPLSQDPKAIEQTAEIQAHEKAQEGKQESKPEVKDKREKDGRFTKSRKYDAVGKPIKPDLSDQKANVEIEPIEEAPVVSKVEPPTFWSAEQKALWAKVPQDVQEVVAARELSYQQELSRRANEIQQGKAFQSRIYEDMESPEAIAAHRNEMALQGIKDPIEELHRYRAWDRIFKTDVLTGIKSLMQKNGLTVEHLYGDESNQYQQYNDPRVEEAIAAAKEAKQLAQEQKDYFNELNTNTILQEIEGFKDGTDSYGNVRRSFVEMYEPQISNVFNYIKGEQPQMSRQTALNHAYEHVLQETRKQFGISSNPAPVQQPKAPEVIAAQSRKAQKAATSVSGSPATGTGAIRPKARTIDEALDRAEEAIYGVT